jgi:hypothetical protein
MNIDQETGETISVVSLFCLVAGSENFSHVNDCTHPTHSCHFWQCPIRTLAPTASEGALAPLHPLVCLFRLCYHYHGQFRLGGKLHVTTTNRPWYSNGKTWERNRDSCVKGSDVVAASAFAAAGGGSKQTSTLGTRRPVLFGGLTWI